MHLPLGSTPVDADGDGYRFRADCDNWDPERHPGVREVIGDGVDSDCDGGDSSARWARLDIGAASGLHGLRIGAAGDDLIVVALADDVPDCGEADCATSIVVWRLDPDALDDGPFERWTYPLGAGEAWNGSFDLDIVGDLWLFATAHHSAEQASLSVFVRDDADGSVYPWTTAWDDPALTLDDVDLSPAWWGESLVACGASGAAAVGAVSPEVFIEGTPAVFPATGFPGTACMSNDYDYSGSYDIAWFGGREYEGSVDYAWSYTEGLYPEGSPFSRSMWSPEADTLNGPMWSYIMDGVGRIGTTGYEYYDIDVGEDLTVMDGILRSWNLFAVGGYGSTVLGVGYFTSDPGIGLIEDVALRTMASGDIVYAARSGDSIVLMRLGFQ